MLVSFLISFRFVFSKVWNFYILKASEKDNKDGVKLLAENCADLNVKDESGETTLHKGSFRNSIYQKYYWIICISNLSLFSYKNGSWQYRKLISW